MSRSNFIMNKKFVLTGEQYPIAAALGVDVEEINEIQKQRKAD